MIVITGATGLVGTVLVKALVDSGKNVRIIIRPTSNMTPFKNMNIDIVTGDVRHKSSLNEAFRGANIVYHLAGIVSITPGKTEMLEEVNVQGTKNVIAACIENDVNRLVYMSSIHALAELPHGQLIDESAPIHPDKVVGHYAKSKAKATLSIFAAKERGLDVVVVYPSGIIGPYSHSVSNMAQMIIDYVKGKIPVLIDGTYDFVDVRDVVAGTITAGEKGRSGEGYILSGYQITLKQLFHILSHLTDRKMPKIRLPYCLLKMFIPLATWLAKKRGQVPTLTSYALYTISSNSLFSHEKATLELNYMPRHIARTIEDTFTWYQSIGEI